jgi:hypothetical protein
MANFMEIGGHTELKSVFSLHLIYEEREQIYETTMLSEPVSYVFMSVLVCMSPFILTLCRLKLLQRYISVSFDHQ